MCRKSFAMHLHISNVKDSAYAIYFPSEVDTC